MNYTNYQIKMVVLKVLSLKKSLAFFVAAWLLLLAGVASVGRLVAKNVTVTAEEQITHHPQDAGLPYVEPMLITCKCQMAVPFPSAETVTVESSAGNVGLLQGRCYCYHLLKMMKGGIMKDDVLSDLEKKILIGRKLGVFDDFAGRQLLLCFSYGIQDKFIVSQIEKRVTSAQRRIALSGTPFLPPQLHNGDFIFGYDQHSDPIRIYQQYLNAGTLMVAGTGAGKTNVSRNHAIQIAPYVRGLWLVDLRKREFRSLRPIFAQMGIDLRIIRCRKFRINPLQVPYGVEPIEYAAVAADFLVRVFNLPPRASTLLRSTIIKLYIAHGIVNGGQKYPTLFHLREAVRQDRQANPQARQATLDNLEAILLALGPEILAYHRGWPVHLLAQQHLVLELTGLPETGKDLILNYLMTAEFISRIARGISNPLMDLWITFDEGQRMFSQRKESAGYGGNALIDLTGLLRGTGIGLEISVLTTNDLSVSIPNLTSTKIIGRCGSLAEYTTAGRFVGMNAEQIEWCSHHMVPGLFVGQVSEGRWRYPFLFTVPLVDRIVRQSVSDREADNSIRNVVTSKLLPA